jgi:hypothetical protein
LKNINSTILNSAILVLTIYVGSQLAFQSLNGKTIVNVSGVGVARDPAAIQKQYDFAELKGSALEYASKERLIKKARIISESGFVGIQLGHYLTRDNNGSKAFACQMFDRVEVEFEADGFAVNGERPSLIVSGACVASADINTIEPLWIPIARIMADQSGDSEYEFREKGTVSIRLNNIGEEWPLYWTLTGVKLYDSNGQNGKVEIDLSEIKTILNKPVQMIWSN